MAGNERDERRRLEVAQVCDGQQSRDDGLLKSETPSMIGSIGIIAYETVVLLCILE